MVETFVLSVDDPLRADRYEIANCDCCEVSETAEGRSAPFLLKDSPHLSLSLSKRSRIHSEYSPEKDRSLDE